MSPFLIGSSRLVSTGTGGLSARDVLERWSVDELDGTLPRRALCSHALVIGDLLQSGVLWSCEGARRNQSLITNWFIFQCLSKCAYHAR